MRFYLHGANIERGALNFKTQRKIFFNRGLFILIPGKCKDLFLMCILYIMDGTVTLIVTDLFAHNHTDNYTI